jgi:hypothetical protein
MRMAVVVFSGAEGARDFVEQGIDVPVLVVPGRGRARAVRVLAQVDTGSTISSIDAGLAALLRLRPRGSTPVAGFGGTVMARQYDASLQTVDGVVLTGGPLLGANLADPPLHSLADVQQGVLLALLGRDALARLDLRVLGPSGSWTAVEPK